MRKLVFILSVAAVIAAFTQVSSASSVDRVTRQCPQMCKVGITVNPGSTTEWTSSQKFGRHEIAYSHLLFKGREMEGSIVKGSCVASYSGYGILAYIYACDNGRKASPLRVKVVTLRKSSAKVTFAYGPR